MRRILFCEINDTCYRISLKKEVLKRHIKNAISKEKLTTKKQKDYLPNIVKAHSSVLVRKLHGVDVRLQENKVTNIELACKKINGIVIKPGETFSFWKAVGPVNSRRGYKEGLVIVRGVISSGIGGGLCQMANMLNFLIMNSPLDVTEIHYHSEALFPDERRKVPFGTGTSVSYNYIDYRFKNNTDQEVQILVWTDNGELCGELRSHKPYKVRYRLIEENHHYSKEGDDYYRISQVYRIVIDRESNDELRKELIRDNHSIVMYDHSLIPEDEIWKGEA